MAQQSWKWWINGAVWLNTRSRLMDSLWARQVTCNLRITVIWYGVVLTEMNVSTKASVTDGS